MESLQISAFHLLLFTMVNLGLSAGGGIESSNVIYTLAPKSTFGRASMHCKTLDKGSHLTSDLSCLTTAPTIKVGLIERIASSDGVPSCVQCSTLPNGTDTTILNPDKLVWIDEDYSPDQFLDWRLRPPSVSVTKLHGINLSADLPLGAAPGEIHGNRGLLLAGTIDSCLEVKVEKEMTLTKARGITVMFFPYLDKTNVGNGVTNEQSYLLAIANTMEGSLLTLDMIYNSGGQRVVTVVKYQRQKWKVEVGVDTIIPNGDAQISVSWSVTHGLMVYAEEVKVGKDKEPEPCKEGSGDTPKIVLGCKIGGGHSTRLLLKDSLQIWDTYKDEEYFASTQY